MPPRDHRDSAAPEPIEHRIADTTCRVRPTRLRRLGSSKSATSVAVSRVCRAPGPARKLVNTMQLLIPIAANVVLGVVLIGLFLSRQTVDDARLSDGGEALTVFRRRFPDADGPATLTADHRGALIQVRRGTGVGLLQRRGRRWTARELAPRDLRSVTLTGGDTLVLSLADFGWPPAHFQIADAEVCAAWLARLERFAAGGDRRRSPVSSSA